MLGVLPQNGEPDMRSFALLLSCASWGCLGWSDPVAQAGSVDSSCSFEGHKLQGRVQFVTSFPDVKVEVVSAFPDLKVQKVTSFPDSCGKWQIVDSSPDLKVQIVTAFPDVKVEYVTAFPGVP